MLRFWAPFGGLRDTYDVHLRLIVKRVVNFLLVLIDLFSLGGTCSRNGNKKLSYRRETALQPV